MSCPFGVPKYQIDIDQMMKCDMCYDRTSVGKKPMCATVCPSGALTFTTMQNIQRTRQGVPVNEWRFGAEIVRTKVYVIVPKEVTRVDVDLVQIVSTPAALPPDPYDVALMLEN
jgi:Fe-S-cluster-containing dehydrogenase component